MGGGGLLRLRWGGGARTHPKDTTFASARQKQGDNNLRVVTQPEVGQFTWLDQLFL
jgi:hypothetical protein